jgi:hypothetical protein
LVKAIEKIIFAHKNQTRIGTLRVGENDVALVNNIFFTESGEIAVNPQCMGSVF